MPEGQELKPQPLPSWVSELFRPFALHIQDLARVLHLSIAGISMLRSRRDMLTVVAHVTAKPASEDDLAGLEEERALAQSELDNDFPLLHEQAAVALWGSLEALVRSFVAAWLAHRPDAWSADAIRRLKVRLGDYEPLPPSDRCLWVADLLDQEIGGPLRNGVGRFETLLAPFSLHGEVAPQVQKTLFELSQVRHAVVHRRGIADRRLIDACPWLGLSVGDRIRISHSMWRTYSNACAVYGLELFQRTRLAYGLERYVPETADSTVPPADV